MINRVCSLGIKSFGILKSQISSGVYWVYNPRFKSINILKLHGLLPELAKLLDN